MEIADLVSRTIPRGECREWQGKRTAKGYGLVKVKGRWVRVHRLVLVLKLGRSLEEGEQAQHTCDNPPCIEPKHLKPGDQADNVQDMWSRGRNKPLAPPEKPAARLTRAQVIEIRVRYRAGEQQGGLALEFGVTESTISQAVRGRTWADVAGAVTEDEARGLVERKASGARAAKLTYSLVEQMRELRTQGWTYAALGLRYGVDEDTASRAVRGLTWKLA